MVDRGKNIYLPHKKSFLWQSDKEMEERNKAHAAKLSKARQKKVAKTSDFPKGSQSNLCEKYNYTHTNNKSRCNCFCPSPLWLYRLCTAGRPSKIDGFMYICTGNIAINDKSNKDNGVIRIIPYSSGYLS